MKIKLLELEITAMTKGILDQIDESKVISHEIIGYVNSKEGKWFIYQSDEKLYKVREMDFRQFLWDANIPQMRERCSNSGLTMSQAFDEVVDHYYLLCPQIYLK